MENKNFKYPDETRMFPKGKVELVTVNGITFGKGTFEPGWRWSESVKPIAKTESCQMPHTQFVISGQLGVRMDDGTEKVFGPGDAGYVPPGHEGWVIGNEPVVVIDITGLKDYARPDGHKH